METAILTASIGVVGSIVGSVLTILLQRFLDNRPLSPLLGQERRAALEGTWSAEIHQRGPIRIVKVPSWSMKTKRRYIEGKATLEAIRDGRTITLPLTFTGGLVHGRFFEVKYHGKESLVQFGHGILELSLDGQVLQGAFVGIGPFAGRIIQGTIELKKPSE